MDAKATVRRSVRREMPNRRYTQEFKQSAVEQVILGQRTVHEVAKSMEMSAKTLENWLGRAHREAQARKRLGERPVTDVQAELSRLRQENVRLRMEAEILKKAAAYFARGPQ